LTDIRRFCVHPAVVTFAILSLFAWVTLNGRLLTAYDDYSHWAAIVRCMQTNQRLPNFLDAEYIVFQTYPPHAACDIYYLCNALGLNDGSYLVCQAIIKCSGIVALFLFAEKPAKRTSAFFAVLCAALFLSFQPGNSLQVDALLASHTMAALAAVYVWRKELNKHFWEILLLVSAILLTKNSGIFFALLVILVFWLYSKKHAVDFKNTLYLLGAVLLLFILWRKHAKYVFVNSKHSPHAVSLGVYWLHLRQNLPTLLQTLGLFLQRTFSVASNSAIYSLLAVLLLDLAAPAGRKKWHSTLFLFGVFVVYSISLLGVYLLSMSNRELTGQNMKDYGRYIVPCAMFLFAMAGCKIHAAAVSGMQNRLQRIAVLGACILLGVSAWQYHQLGSYDRFWREYKYAENFINTTRNLQKEHNVPHHASVLVVYPDDTQQYNFSGYIGRYVFMPSAYSFLSETEWSNMASDTFPADGTYVVNLGENTVEMYQR